MELAKAPFKGLLARLLGRAGPPPAEGRHESFLVYHGALYLRLAALLCAACIALYVFYVPALGRSGDSFAGYVLGILGAAIIVWLAWLGVRKRSFAQGRGRLQAWTSAHVYLGLSLLVIVTLHSSFRFGLNVHTLAYVLMLLVVVSGGYGIVAYANLPRRITANRQNMEFRAMLSEVQRLNDTAVTLADKIDAETHAVIVRSIAKVKIGGSPWEQLSGRYGDPGAVGIMDRFLQLKAGQLQQAPSAPRPPAPPPGGAQPPARRGRNTTIFFIADQIFQAGGNVRGDTLQKLVETLAHRKTLVERINRDITLRARQNVWLFVHVPLTIALLVALLAHVLSVFAYW